MKAKSLVVLEGAALLVGTIFGAGFLVLPYTALKAGVFTSLFWLFGLAVVVTLLHLMYGDIVLGTEGNHRLPGYARIYLGRGGEVIAMATFVFAVFGGLLVYLLLGSRFLYGLGFKDFGFTPTATTIVFWLVMTALVFLSLKLSSRFNFVVTFATMAILLGLSVFSFGKYVNLENFFLAPERSFLFPYGIVLFSLVGYLAIPEIVKLFDEEAVPRGALRKVVIGGTLFSGLFSGLAMLAILGASGGATSQDALSGLENIFPAWALSLAFSLAFLESATSYLIFGIALREALKIDFHLSNWLVGGLVGLLPIGFFFSGLTDFVKIIGILGTLGITLDGILISFIWRKLKAKNPQGNFLHLSAWVPVFLVLLFAIGGFLSLFFGH